MERKVPDMAVAPFLAWPPCELPPGLTALHAENLQEPHRRSFEELARHGYTIIDIPDAGWLDTCERARSATKPELQHASRVQDAWKRHEPVRQLAISPSIEELLCAAYGRAPIPFQTLNFARGTEQETHSDAWHFHCIPERWLCGVWVALEDVDEENGALHVYPGSHRLPIIGPDDLTMPANGDWEGQYQNAMDAIVRGYDLSKEIVRLKRGQAVVWAANLLHGGEPVRDRTRTRWSQVTHYYFCNCAYYLPRRSDVLGGDVRLRHVMDIRTGNNVPHCHRGKVLRPTAEQSFWEKPTLGGFLRVVAERLLATLGRRLRSRQ